MATLKKAREGKIEDFIKEHEADPEGDLDKRDAVAWLHAKADRMVDPKAQDILNTAAFGLGNDALRATPDVATKDMEAK